MPRRTSSGDPLILWEAQLAEALHTTTARARAWAESHDVRPVAFGDLEAVGADGTPRRRRYALPEVTLHLTRGVDGCAGCHPAERRAS